MTIITTIFLFQIPLIIFDLRHNFFVLKSFLSFLLKIKDVSINNFGFKFPTHAFKIFPNTLSRFLFISGEKDITSQILPCNDLTQLRLSQISLPVFLISAMLLVFFIVSQFKKDKKALGQKIIFFHLLIGLIGIIIYNLFLPGYAFEWILVIFFPAFALITGSFLNMLLQKSFYFKSLVILILCLFILFNLNWLSGASNKFGLLSKAKAVQYATQEIGRQPFSLDSLGSCFSQGYIYLFHYYGHLPAKSYADDMFSSTVFSKPQQEPSLKVIMVNPSVAESEKFWKKYFDYKSREIKSKKVNEIEVIIVKN